MTVEDLKPRRSLGIWLAIGLVAIGVRCAAAMVYWPETQTDPDAYVGLARNLATGVGFCTPGSTHATAYRPPLYPILLACGLIMMGWQGGALVVVVNILCDLITILAVGRWCARRSMPFWAIGLALAFLVCDPLALRYTALPMTEICFTALSTVATLWLVDLIDPPITSTPAIPAWRWVLSGALCGLAALCRPSIWPFWGVFGGFLVWRVLRPRREAIRLRSALIWGTALGLTVLPWVIRNQFVLGSPKLTTTHGGYTLWLANNPVFFDEVARKPWGTVWTHDSLVTWQHESLRRMDAELGTGAAEIAQDRWFANQAMQAIQHDPAGFGWAMWYRLRSFWSLSPRGSQTPHRIIQGLLVAWYFLLFLLAGWGVFLGRQRATVSFAITSYIALLQLVHLFYWTDTRMRLPIHPWLAILAAYGAMALLEWRRSLQNPADARSA